MAINFTVFKGSPTGQVVESTSTLPDLSSNEVLLENTHSGVCGTDAHYLHQDMVLGHEGVGIAKAVGENVKSIKIGDRLGFGFVKGGCGSCQYCTAGYTFHCNNAPRVYAQTDLNQGSFATHSVWPQSRLMPIPSAITSSAAGPFMCAGQSTFVPFFRGGIKPTDRVGIVGIGGLGHLAIQFASAWGCDVVVFSGAEGKREEAMEFGANQFVNAKTMGKDVDIGRKLDYLLVTTSQQPDWDLYLDLMAPFGHIYPLTISMKPLQIPYLPLIIKELSIHGSCSSTPVELQKMLEFVALHNIKPMVQEFPMSVSGINEAFKKLEAGEIRYRGVLKV